MGERGRATTGRPPRVVELVELLCGKWPPGAGFPAVRFALAEPLGRHPLLIEVLEERAREAE